MFLRNIDYLMGFVRKHGYSEKVNVGYSGGRTPDHIVYVIFNKKDVPSGKKIRIEDVRYDIDTELPRDIFFQWLKYCDDHKDEDMTYIHWITKTSNLYEPSDLDKSGSEELKQKLESAINLIKSKLHSYKTQFKSDDYKKMGD